MTGIRIYGHRFGQGSFTQVTTGFRMAAEDVGVLEGFVPIDGLRDEMDLTGARADVAVNCGAPSATAYATTMGIHKKRWLMLAPNSDLIPESMVEWLPRYITGLLTPSAWGKEVLEKFFPKMPIVVCPHGVHPKFRVLDTNRNFAREEYQAGKFEVVHLTSTNAQRKGTRDLLDGWKLVLASKMLPAQARLNIIAPTAGVAEQRHWAVERGFTEAEVRVGVERSLDHDAFIYWLSAQHLVVQPSRGEGFGLVPLEMRALGIPCAATTCTGHAEHFPLTQLDALSQGCVTIPTGSLAELDDLPGSKGPSVSPEAIADAIELAYRQYENLETLCRVRAMTLASEWSWTNKTGPILARILRPDMLKVEDSVESAP